MIHIVVFVPLQIMAKGSATQYDEGVRNKVAGDCINVNNTQEWIKI